MFQRRIGIENRPVGIHGFRRLLNFALAATGLADASGMPLTFTPHDFRRIFTTEAVLNGMPPHIAQLILGHKDINTTMGYKAVYPEEAINSHRAFIARRRALGPAKNTVPRPTPSGKSSSATSSAAGSPSAIAGAHTAPAASMSTAVSGARSSGLTRPSARGWKKSATT